MHNQGLEKKSSHRLFLYWHLYNKYVTCQKSALQVLTH
uniref:Uncharacterized protein n=1 Tax=Anguilla anguilla TaxID=7936 RepID=A0A0E9RBB9_ANGAN